MSRSRTIMKRVAQLGAAVMLALGVWIAGEVIAGYLGLPPAYHWTSVVAEFDVNGQRVDVGGIAECERHFGSLLERFVPTERRLPWKTRSFAYATGLDDGSVLLIRPPVPCGRWNRPLTDYLPDDFYPLVYWLDDAEAPSRMEVYFSKQYYERPDARIRLIDFRVRRLGIGFTPLRRPSIHEDPDRIFELVPWLRSREPLGFRGFVATVAGREVWQQVPGLDAAIDQSAGLTLLGPKSELAQDERLLGPASALLCPGIKSCSDRQGRRTDEHGCRIDVGRYPTLCDGIGRSFGMQTDADARGAALLNRRDNLGVIHLLPIPPEGRLFGGLVRRIQIDDREIRGQLSSVARGWFVYDPAAQEIIYLQVLNVFPIKFSNE